MGTRSSGFPCEESRRPFEDVTLFTEYAILFAEPAELLSLSGREPVVTAGVDVGLAHPVPNRGLGQVHLSGDGAHRLAAAADELDHLGLELCGEAPTRSPLLRSTGHQDILSGASPHTLGVRQTGSSPESELFGTNIKQG